MDVPWDTDIIALNRSSWLLVFMRHKQNWIFFRRPGCREILNDEHTKRDEKCPCGFPDREIVVSG